MNHLKITNDTTNGDDNSLNCVIELNGAILTQVISAEIIIGIEQPLYRCNLEFVETHNTEVTEELLLTLEGNSTYDKRAGIDEELVYVNIGFDATVEIIRTPKQKTKWSDVLKK